MRFVTTIGGSLVLLLAASASHAADVSNGGFETGNLTGWFSSGSTAIVQGSDGYGAQAGNFSALVVALSQAPVPPFSCETDIWNPACPQPLPFAASGNALPTHTNFQAAGVGVVFIRGAFIGQDVAVNAGDTISWDWTPYGEAQGGMFSIDKGRFYATNGTIETFLDYDSGASSHTFADSGLWSVYFGLYQTQDPFGWSAMRFDSIRITAVPEPTGAALLLFGLFGLGMLKSRFSSAPESP